MWRYAPPSGYLAPPSTAKWGAPSRTPAPPPTLQWGVIRMERGGTPPYPPPLPPYYTPPAPPYLRSLFRGRGRVGVSRAPSTPRSEIPFDNAEISPLTLSRSTPRLPIRCPVGGSIVTFVTFVTPVTKNYIITFRFFSVFLSCSGPTFRPFLVCRVLPKKV